MKTMKLIAVIGLVMFCMSAIAASPDHVTTPNGGSSEGFIKYAISIHGPDFYVMPNAHFYVVITDQNGRRIAPPQLVTGLKSIYLFSEQGPVIGSRVARLAEAHDSPSFIPFSCTPDIKSGAFQNGLFYNFNLYPSLAVPQ
jgi:hypothetical protein